MYCGCCGEVCVIPEGYEGSPIGVVINKENKDDIKVIRCVECTNKYGMDTSDIYVCVSVKEKWRMINKALKDAKNMRGGE